MHAVTVDGYIKPIRALLKGRPGNVDRSFPERRRENPDFSYRTTIVPFGIFVSFDTDDWESIPAGHTDHTGRPSTNVSPSLRRPSNRSGPDDVRPAVHRYFFWPFPRRRSLPEYRADFRKLHRAIASQGGCDRDSTIVRGRNTIQITVLLFRNIDRRRRGRVYTSLISINISS